LCNSGYDARLEKVRHDGGTPSRASKILEAKSYRTMLVKRLPFLRHVEITGVVRHVDASMRDAQSATQHATRTTMRWGNAAAAQRAAAPAPQRNLREPKHSGKLGGTQTAAL